MPFDQAQNYWFDHDIRFDLLTRYLKPYCSGEKIIDVMEPIEDTKGNNGEPGKLIVTNLRLIWQSKKFPKINLSIGYNPITLISIKTATSKLRGLTESLHILARTKQSRYEFIFTNLVQEHNRLFALVIGVHRSYTQSRLFREIKMRSATVVSNKKLQMLPQVADQTGKALELPEEEKKSLACALALHEKGRTALKAHEYTKALVFLLEADASYNQCQSGLLQNVDNYGLLNLDIAWCYLSLQSIAELPAVDARLQNCERTLHRSYGENMERVIALKGSTGTEAALFVRLHLLQGIVAYHQGHLERSKYLLQKVDDEVKRLQVSDDALCELINMGYKTDEARLALRTTFGNVPAAVDWILRKREEKETIYRQEKEDLRRKKMQKKLGNCHNGDPVNVDLWRSMKEMGFNAVLASNALKQTNNNLDAALQLVTDDMFVSQVVSSIRTTAESAPGTSAQNVDPNTTTSSDSNATTTFPNGGTPGLMQELAQLANFLSEELSDDRISVEQAERSQKAYDALAKDIGSEADYIDLTLSSESTYLNQYKELLRM